MFLPYSRFGNKVGVERSCPYSLVFASSAPCVATPVGQDDQSSTASRVMGMFYIKTDCA